MRAVRDGALDYPADIQAQQARMEFDLRQV